MIVSHLLQNLYTLLEPITCYLTPHSTAITPRMKNGHAAIAVGLHEMVYISALRDRVSVTCRGLPCRRSVFGQSLTEPRTYRVTLKCVSEVDLVAGWLHLMYAAKPDV